MRNTLRAVILAVGTALTILAQGTGSLPIYAVRDNLQGTVRLQGSDSIDPLVRLWIEEFEKIQPEVHFNVVSHGSATAPPALVKEESDIGHMSRAMNDAEVEAFRVHFGHEPMGITVAFDALAIYVNRRNPIKSISIPQLDAIYGTKRLAGAEKSIDSWSAFGLHKRIVRKYKIRAYTRDENSGSRAFFMEKVLQKGGTFKEGVNVNDQLGIMASIGHEIQGIGYGPESYKNPMVRMVPLIGLGTDKPYLPTLENIQTGRYPLSRTLYFYLDHEAGKPLSPAIQAFLEFVLSKKGQELAKGYGSAPLTPVIAEAELANLK